MPNHDNLRTMQNIAADLLADFLNLWDRLLLVTGDTAHVPYGQLPAVNRLTVTADMPPSSRLTSDVAMGYLAAYVLTDDQQRLQTGCKLLRHAFSRQHPHGWFVWNYGQYEIDQVDLGTVLDTYHYFLTLAGDKLPDDIRRGIRHSTQRAIAYLATAEQPQHPGIIQKRAPDPDHPTAKTTAQYQSIDVINGNALAATAWCRAATILEDEAMFDRAARFQQNIVESFGRHQSGWWSYVEQIETREQLCAESILYQAMTALYLEPLYRARPTPALQRVLCDSLRTLDGITDADGRLDWSHEARKDFEGTALLMLPSAAAALADVCDVTSAALRRLTFVAGRLYDRQAHLLRDEDGKISDELRQIWAVSDLALIIFSARSHHNALAARPA